MNHALLLADPDEFDLCVCGDFRKHHQNRDGLCLLCRGHFDTAYHCQFFRAKGEA